MKSRFATLPPDINTVITHLLSRDEQAKWLNRAEKLHKRYMTGKNDAQGSYIHDFTDILAYLGLRTPATYAQILGALSQVQEVIPSWQPRSLLDIGSGPGIGIWAAAALWPSLEKATALDQEKDFLAVGRDILQTASLSIDVSWQQYDITTGIEDTEKGYDLILIANVLNELSISERKRLLGQAYTMCHGIMVIIEPGTAVGVKIVQEAAKDFSGKAALLAPYTNNVFAKSDPYWIHFSQRFIRPDFQRRMRQHMRESSLMASDWEEAKYAYAALGKISSEEKVWGRVIGPTKKQKGFLEVPILTENGTEQVKVLKRHTKEYSFAKNLQWGQVIQKSTHIIPKTSENE